MKKHLTLFFFITAYIWAAPFATVVKVDGKAKIQHLNSIKKSTLTTGETLDQGDTVLTYRDSKVVLKMQDKTKIVLSEYAKLQLLTEDEYVQSGGKVFFKVTKRQTGKGLAIKTPFAIIGVKGTEFVITDDNQSKALALKEGLVGVDSPDGKPYALVDQDKVDAMLAGTPQGQMAEFEAYKKELMAEFTEFVKSFDLRAGKKLSFKGSTVSQSSIESSDEGMFSDFAADAEYEATEKELENDFFSDK